MGGRNSGPKSNMHMFERLNSFESTNSKKTLPCLGLIEYSQKGSGLFEKHNLINRIEERCIDRLNRQRLPEKLSAGAGTLD